MTRVSFLQLLRCFKIQYACRNTSVIAECRCHVYVYQFVQKQTKYPICYFNMHQRWPRPEKSRVSFKYSIGREQCGLKIGRSPRYYLFIYCPTRHTHIHRGGLQWIRNSDWGISSGLCSDQSSWARIKRKRLRHSCDGPCENYSGTRRPKLGEGPRDEGINGSLKEGCT